MVLFCLYADRQYILPVISVTFLSRFLIFGVLIPEKTAAVLRRRGHAECKGVLIQGDMRQDFTSE